jgi:hypothetical protein
MDGEDRDSDNPSIGVVNGNAGRDQLLSYDVRRN